MFFGFIEGVEGVEELLLSLFFTFQQLDVVNEEHVVGAVAAFKRSLAAGSY